MAKPNPETLHLLYEADDKPPHILSAIIGLQTVSMIIGGIVLTPVIVLSATDMKASQADWAIFAALVICGLTTIIQARPIGQFGSGYALFMGTSGPFIAISVLALNMGGLPLLGTLVIISALVQFLMAGNLSMFRAIITPTVRGTIICMIALMVMPIGFEMVSSLPEGSDASPRSPMWIAILTVIVLLGISFYTSGQSRLWAPMIALFTGYICAYYFGLVDLHKVVSAPIVGLPSNGWPGLDFSFSSSFWTLLPAFVIVTIVGTFQTYDHAVAIQHASSKTVGTTDYRLVEGAVNVDGLGNFLSGLACTLPNTTYSTSVAILDITGVASRRVAIYGGLLLVVLAFFPKLSALLQSIPEPVLGGFVCPLMVFLFLHGIRLVISDGLPYDKALIFGISFWIGLGFQNKQIFDGLLPQGLADFFGTGVTAGGTSAILLSLLITLKNKRLYQHIAELTDEGLFSSLAFVSNTAKQAGWTGKDLYRLTLAAEEAFIFLRENDNSKAGKLKLSVRLGPDEATIELTSFAAGVNVETLIREMSSEQDPSSATDDDIRLAILQGVTADLKHEQFNEAEILRMTLLRETVRDI
ncbi:MAG: hypothetical protein OXC66_14045 [Roseovarius sp.]|nr:hypothetical protein [Roseovarius sp.]